MGIDGRCCLYSLELLELSSLDTKAYEVLQEQKEINDLVP